MIYETQSLKSSHQALVPSAVQTSAAAGRYDVDAAVGSVTRQL